MKKSELRQIIREEIQKLIEAEDHKPGEVWPLSFETPGNVPDVYSDDPRQKPQNKFAAKNSKGETRYYPTRQAAQKFANS
jgi:hypothetical protein